MVMLANVLSRLEPVQILVIGDILLDTYTIGKAKRISPEAPVAVVNVHREEHRPGGSGNVILNLISLGAKVKVIGRVGKDWGGMTIIEALKSEGVDTSTIFFQNQYQTPVKNRIIADQQQVVRVDKEEIVPLDVHLEKLILDRLTSSMEDVKVIAISDYGKGFLSVNLLQAVIRLANEKGIPVITDPKGNDFSKYRGTTIIKPNLSEAIAASKLSSSSSLLDMASAILKEVDAQLLMVTRSQAGISLFNRDRIQSDFPVQAKEVKDVTGAGDTVLAMLAYAVGNGLSYSEAADLCNHAAAIAIEQVGCARVSLSDLAMRFLEQNRGYKVFDREHLFVLKRILKTKPYNLLIFAKSIEFNQSIFQSLKNLSSEKEILLICVEETSGQDIFIELLASLREVSFILLERESRYLLCEEVAPNSIFLFNAEESQPILMDPSRQDLLESVGVTS